MVRLLLCAEYKGTKGIQKKKIKLCPIKELIGESQGTKPSMLCGGRELMEAAIGAALKIRCLGASWGEVTHVLSIKNKTRCQKMTA